jgi:hypothetical protein
MYLLRAADITRVSRAYRQPVSAGARPVHEAGNGAKSDIEVHPSMPRHAAGYSLANDDTDTRLSRHSSEMRTSVRRPAGDFSTA